MKRIPLTVLILGLVAGAFAGCNVFEGLHEEGSSDDPEVLLADADAALQNGEPEKAVMYLEKAHEREPENPVVRVRLSTALLRANDVDFLEMKHLGEHISGKGRRHDGRPGPTALTDDACNFDESRKVEELDFTQNDVFHLIKHVAPHLRRINGLLRPLMNDRARMNVLSRLDRKSVYLNLALSEVLTIILDVAEKRDELQAVLWRLDNREIGLCAKDESALLEMQIFVKCIQIPRLQNALDLLKLGINENNSRRNTIVEDAIEELQENIGLLASEIDVSCS